MMVDITQSFVLYNNDYMNFTMTNWLWTTLLIVIGDQKTNDVHEERKL